MILSAGERAVWAATFARARVAGCGVHGAALAAARDVDLLRAWVKEYDGVDADPPLAMARAMLGDDQ